MSGVFLEDSCGEEKRLFQYYYKNQVFLACGSFDIDW